VGAEGEFLIEVDVGALVALLTGKTCGYEGLGQHRRTRNMHAAAIEPGSAAALGGEELIEEGVVDDTGYQGSILPGFQAGRTLLETQRDAEVGESVGEVGGAVEWIDVPAIFAFEAVARTFLAIDSVGGECFAEARADQFLGGAIGDGHQIHVALVFGFDALDEKLLETRAGFTRDRGSLRNPPESRGLFC